MSFAANCFRKTEVKCIKKTMVVHEFDDKVAVVTTTVASITTGIVQFQAKQESVRPRWPYDMRPSVRAEKYIRDASG